MKGKFRQMELSLSSKETLIKQTNLCNFMWEDRFGNFYSPEQMMTHHLFSVILMIWNHSAPDHLKFKPYQQYILSSRFTNEYCKKVIKEFLRVFKLREDAWEYSSTIRKMEKRFKEYMQIKKEIE